MCVLWHWCRRSPSFSQLALRQHGLGRGYRAGKCRLFHRGVRLIEFCSRALRAAFWWSKSFIYLLSTSRGNEPSFWWAMLVHSHKNWQNTVGKQAVRRTPPRCSSNGSPHWAPDRCSAEGRLQAAGFRTTLLRQRIQLASDFCSSVAIGKFKAKVKSTARADIFF